MHHISQPMKEVTPLTEADCLLVFSRLKSEFNFPLHTHKEYELNFIQNARGAQRIVGDSIESISDLELTLITGENTEHAWFTHECRSGQIKEITIQFHHDLLNESTLNKTVFRNIAKLFNDAKRGVTFTEETIRKVQSRIELLSQQYSGLPAVMELFHILNDLSVANDVRILASDSVGTQPTNFESRRIDSLYDFIRKNYQRDISLDEAADVVKMSRVAFCRFVKRHTGKTFVEILNDVRIGHAVNLLINTTHTVSEICYLCGFNNISNFNRVFLKNKNCTPSELRIKYKINRVVI